MSTLHKVKAYFGMAPMEDYDDEYYEDDDRGSARGYSRRPREDRFDDDGLWPRLRGPRLRRTTGRLPRRLPRRGAFRIEAAGPKGLRPADTPVQRPARLDPRRTRDGSAPDGELFEEGSPLSKITTLRPKDYSEARTIGERFRDGTPVIMDLVSMDNADAKRLVDFAAGLAFALRGSFDKVATKVFLLSPADIDVSAEERRRIAEAGFYAYQ